MVKIYTLEDPITGKIRYIGKTKQTLNKRLDNHIYGKSTSHKKSWIISLLKQNKFPIIEELETVLEEEWRNSEIYWISQFKAWGFNLTNMTDGGDGVEYTKEVREKIRKSHKGRKQSKETIEKKIKGLIGKKRTQEQKDNIKRGLQPYFNKLKIEGQSEKQKEHLKKLIESNKDRPLNYYTIQKLQKGRDLYWASRERIKPKEKIRKKIALINDDNEIIEIYTTIREASKKLNLNETSICKVCKGQRNSLFNKKFKYIENE